MTFETKFRNFVGMIESLTKEEIVIISRSLLEEFNNERHIVIEGWKGKGSFSFSEVGDKIIVTKFQKPEKDAEPKEINIEISQKELIGIEKAIKLLFELQGNTQIFIKSTAIAEYYYSLPWKQIFSDRKIHNKFTLILNVLDNKGLIEYKGGRVYLK